MVLSLEIQKIIKKHDNLRKTCLKYFKSVSYIFKNICAKTSYDQENMFDYKTKFCDTVPFNL